MWEILRKSYRVAVSYICNVSVVTKAGSKVMISKKMWQDRLDLAP